MAHVGTGPSPAKSKKVLDDQDTTKQQQQQEEATVALPKGGKAPKKGGDVPAQKNVDQDEADSQEDDSESDDAPQRTPENLDVDEKAAELARRAAERANQLAIADDEETAAIVKKNKDEATAEQQKARAAKQGLLAKEAKNAASPLTKAGVIHLHPFWRDFHASTSLEHKLGGGGWGSVYHCWPTQANAKVRVARAALSQQQWLDGVDDEAYAAKRQQRHKFTRVVKVVPKHQKSFHGFSKSADELMDEPRVMAYLQQHKACQASIPGKLAPVKAVYESADYLFLVTEAYAETWGELWERLPLAKKRKANLGLYFAQQMSLILTILHSVGVAHRDVKLANVMRGPGLTPVLIDFGQASFRAQPVRLGTKAAVLAKEHQGDDAYAEDVAALGRALHNLHLFDAKKKFNDEDNSSSDEEAPFEDEEVGDLVHKLAVRSFYTPAVAALDGFNDLLASNKELALEQRQGKNLDMIPFQFEAGYEEGGRVARGGAKEEEETAGRRSSKAGRAATAALVAAAQRRWPGVPADHSVMVQHVALRLARRRLRAQTRKVRAMVDAMHALATDALRAPGRSS